MAPPGISHQRLWVGAGTLFFVLFMGKQAMWSMVSKQVKDIREEEHEKSVKVLLRAKEGASRFAIEGLSATQRAEIQRLVKESSAK